MTSSGLTNAERKAASLALWQCRPLTHRPAVSRDKARHGQVVHAVKAPASRGSLCPSLYPLTLFWFDTRQARRSAQSGVAASRLLQPGLRARVGPVNGGGAST